MRRAFTGARWPNTAASAGSARTLAEALWPEGLTAQIRQVSERAGRPLVRIQPLAPGRPDPLGATRRRRHRCPAHRPGGRGDHHRTGVAPAHGIRRPQRRQEARTRTPSSSSSTPASPASAPTPRSARCWARPAPTPSCCRWSGAVSTLAPSYRPSPPPAEAFRRTDLDRDWLSGVLRKGARRLLYVGHVSGAPVEGRAERGRHAAPVLRRGDRRSDRPDAYASAAVGQGPAAGHAPAACGRRAGGADLAGAGPGRAHRL
ncbi:hypothetical protein ACRAWF_16860 [Streptomyces sp. L7]